MNPFRKLLADVVEANGGYSRFLDSDFPLSWEVPIWDITTDFDKVFPKALTMLSEDFGIDTLSIPDTVMKELQEEWVEEAEDAMFFNSVVEDMQSSVKHDDTYKALRPEIAKRYGLSGDDYYEVRFEFHGRGGKHLVVHSFEGVKLEGVSSKDMTEALRSEDESYTNQWCQKLLAMTQEWDLCFTSNNASEEWNYQAAYRLSRMLSDAHEAAEKHALQSEIMANTLD